MFNYWAPFIPLAADETAPLYRLTGNAPWEFGFAAKQAFGRTKEAAKQAIRLFPFQPTMPLDVYTDASGYAIGAMMFQDGKPIAIVSRSLNSAERNYTTTERELLAVVFAAKKWRHYFESTREAIRVRTDHKAITQTLNARGDNRSINRWSLELSPYQFDYLFEPGVTNPADYPSRRADYAGQFGAADAHVGAASEGEGGGSETSEDGQPLHQHSAKCLSAVAGNTEQVRVCGYSAPGRDYATVRPDNVAVSSEQTA
jgi:hypothetical protein